MITVDEQSVLTLSQIQSEAGLQVQLQQLNDQLKDLEGAFRELTRFERETSDKQADQSLTSVALECLRLAS